MTYAGVQMFTDKLNQLINSNDNPLFSYPEIMCEKPQFQLLYQELSSMIQTLFMGEHQDLRILNDLKQRFINAAEEAQYNVDLFLYDVHIWNTFDDVRRSFKSVEMKFTRKYARQDDVKMFMEKLKQLINFFNYPLNIGERLQLQRLYDELDSMTKTRFIYNYDDHQELINMKKTVTAAAVALTGVHVRNNNRSLNLDDVRMSLMNIKAEFKNMRIDDMNSDSSQRPQRTLNQSVAGQSSIFRVSKKAIDEIFEGIDRDVELIRDKLVEDQKELDVVSIVGMGGIGKTTLATKVFNDAYVKHHFYVRVWVNVSQAYDKRSVLTQILEPIRGQLNLEKATDSQLREFVHKNLTGKRYLIVIDDIWDIKTWDDLKVFFPRENTRSRLMLTTRITDVAKHANSNGLIHHLGYLNKEKSWKLLCQKVFHGNECPKWSIKPGMKIVENCHGLPLALVVIAGVLAKEALSEELWVDIAKKTGSYVISEQNGCMEILGLSYSHLPLHLRECFLYLGGFPEDYMFKVQRLIWLWVAEGFIQRDGNRSLEDIAEGYLVDLIDRNLVIGDRWKSNGGVKACKVHDLIRELCLKKAREEQFLLKIDKLTWSSQLNEVKKLPYRQERMYTGNTAELNSVLAIPSAQSCRSILIFGYISSLGDNTAGHFRSFVLLGVLDLQDCYLTDFPKDMELLVHLRYLAIWLESEVGFPSSICNLWNLQTFIYITDKIHIDLPSNITDLVNLKHLWIRHYFFLPFIERLERSMKNLQTISGLLLGERVDNFQKCFPYIKKLTCVTTSDNQNDFKSLTYLENLNLTTNLIGRVKSITFPTTLKTLTLVNSWLPWSEMSIIHSLPNLQVLKLTSDAFVGSCWNTDGQEFPQLKFLRLEYLDIKQWEAHSRSFPCLRQLQVSRCVDLEEIPLEIGDIPTLELIQINECSYSVDESCRRIEEEQHYLGNYDIMIDIQEEEQDEKRSIAEILYTKIDKLSIAF